MHTYTCQINLTLPVWMLWVPYGGKLLLSFADPITRTGLPYGALQSFRPRSSRLGRFLGSELRIWGGDRILLNFRW